MSVSEERDRKVAEILDRMSEPPTQLGLRVALLEAWEHGNRVGNREGADYCTRTVAGIEEAMEQKLDGQRDGAQE